MNYSHENKSVLRRLFFFSVTEQIFYNQKVKGKDLMITNRLG